MRLNIRKNRARVGSVWYAEKTVIGGHTFDSKGEAKRFEELLWLQKVRKIRNLTPHPFVLKFEINDILVGTWLPDYIYTVPGERLPTIEDFKGGKITAEYKIKFLLAIALYGHKFRFVESGPSARSKYRI